MEESFLGKESKAISSFAIVQTFDNHNPQCRWGHNSRNTNNGGNHNNGWRNKCSRSNSTDTGCNIHLTSDLAKLNLSTII